MMSWFPHMPSDGGQSPQPSPKPNEHEPVVPQVQAFLQRRMEFGIARYGIPLQPHNGRDMLVDAFEEAVDLVVYMGGLIIERDGRLPGD